MFRVAAAIALVMLAGCQSEGTADKAGSPPMSVAWDPNEGVRYLLVEGCIPAVEMGLGVKEALDRGGVGLSRVRTLDKSPITNDPPGTPAHALVSGASVVITGTAERCRVASSSGDGPGVREAALKAVPDSAGWITLPPPVQPEDGMKVDARCKATPRGTLLFSLISAPDGNRPMKAIATVSLSQGRCAP